MAARTFHIATRQCRSVRHRHARSSDRFAVDTTWFSDAGQVPPRLTYAWMGVVVEGRPNTDRTCRTGRLARPGSLRSEPPIRGHEQLLRCPPSLEIRQLGVGNFDRPCA